VIVLGFAAIAWSCASRYVTRGADLYAGGHYIEAAEVFERTERRLPDASLAERARYGLYRGATLLALGDAHRAGGWLAYCDDIVTKDPSTLNDEEQVMLKRALALASARRTAIPSSPTEGAAIATGQPLAPASEVGN
jgi:hypothetical protein